MTYTAATGEDKAFVIEKIEHEYIAAVDRLSRLVVRTEKTGEELDEANKGYRFTCHHMMTVKNKKTADTFGYCVSYDSERVVNGTVTDPQKMYSFMLPETTPCLSQL